MPIINTNQIVAGYRPNIRFAKVATPTLIAGRPHSLFYLNGIPGAATASTAGMSGEALTTYTGQIPFTNPVTGQSAYLAKFSGQATQAGILLLCDRLWHNSGLSVTSTSAQTINSVAFPPRDNTGTSNGDGVLIGLEVTTATGSGTPTLTMSYTNQAGVAGRTATNVVATAASSAVGAFYEMGLQAGDTGVRSIQTFTLSATWSSGAVSLVAYRVLAELICNGAFVPNLYDVFQLCLPLLHNNTVPFLIFIPQTTTASVVTGNLVYTHG